MLDNRFKIYKIYHSFASLNNLSLLDKDIWCSFKCNSRFAVLFQNAYPIKVRTMYMLSPPFWFKPTMNIFSKLLREQNTIAIINRQQLLQCMPGSRIPENLGGTLRHDHVAWINQCLYSHSNRGETEKECWKTERGLVNTSYSDPSSRLEARLRKEGLDWEWVNICKYFDWTLWISCYQCLIIR